MQNDQQNQWELSHPFAVDTTREENEGKGEFAYQQMAAPRPPVLHFTGGRVMLLGVVLAGVTMSMLLSFSFLLLGRTWYLPLHFIAFPSSMIGMSLVCVGGGILLWMATSYIFNRHRVVTPSSRVSISPYHLALAQRVACPPGPADGRTGGLVSAHFDVEVDRWMVSEWVMGPSDKQTDTLELTHMRQRLQTLRLFDMDNFSGDRNDQLDQINDKAHLQMGEDSYGHI